MPYAIIKVRKAKESMRQSQSKNIKNEVTKMKLNYNKKTIELSTTELNEASKFGTDLYYQLVEAKRNFPDFKIQTTKSNKRRSGYEMKGLTYSFIKSYISNHGTEDQMLEFDIMRKGIVENGECVKVATYGEIKKWFLESFPEILAASASKNKKEAV